MLVLAGTKEQIEDYNEVFCIYNVSDGNHASRFEVVEWLAERLGVEAPSFTGDDEDDVPNRKVSNDRISDELGWTPAYPSFRDGYQAMLADGG